MLPIGHTPPGFTPTRLPGGSPAVPSLGVYPPVTNNYTPPSRVFKNPKAQGVLPPSQGMLASGSPSNPPPGVAGGGFFLKRMPRRLALVPDALVLVEGTQSPTSPGYPPPGGLPQGVTPPPAGGWLLCSTRVTPPAKRGCEGACIPREPPPRMHPSPVSEKREGYTFPGNRRGLPRKSASR